MRDKKIEIVLFASSTSKGRELSNAINACFSDGFSSVWEKGENQLGCIVKVIEPSDKEFNTLFFQWCQKHSDIVIFDGSLEEEGCVLGDNYKCVSHAPYMSPHVIVVSRTILPLNFIPHTTNVLPFGENYRIDNKGQLRTVTSYNNKEILVYLQNEVKKILEGTASFVQSKAKISVQNDPRLYLSNGEKVAFISYRSYYNEPNKCGGYSVQDLKRYIIDYHKAQNPNEKWKVIYYPPGGLSQDCPTEYLRWALFTYVENVFKHVDEVWILNSDSTDSKSYWDSWFTQGEYLALMGIQHTLPSLMPKVYLFNPHVGDFEILSIMPQIPNSENEEISLISANSDILWGDYAALRNVISFLDKWKRYGKLQKVYWRGITKVMTFVAKPIWGDDLKFDIEGMAKKHQYQPGFLTNRIFSCEKCLKSGCSILSFHDKEFINGFIHIGDPTNHMPGYFVLTQKEFETAVEKGYVECPSCHERYYIYRNPEQDFYLWKKWTKNTNPANDWYIEKVPAYSIKESLSR